MPFGDDLFEIVRAILAAPSLPVPPFLPLLPSPPGIHVVPPFERVFRADAELRDDDHDPGGRDVVERKQRVAAMEAECRAALEKVRDVGAEPRGRVLQLLA